jgi:hypothetical protein
VKVGVRRFQIVKWFGDLGNRKFKTIRKPIINKCRACESPMKIDSPVGVEGIVANRGERGFMKDFMVEHVDDRMTDERSDRGG